MTQDISTSAVDENDTPQAVEFRFGIETLSVDIHEATTTMSMPIANLINPLTGQPTIGPLAILIDDVGGMVNVYRREPHEWPVTSELALELSPNTLDIIGADPEEPVVATGHPQSPKGGSSLALCTLTHGGTVIGCATVRSFYVPMPPELPGYVGETLNLTPTTPLGDLMAVAPMGTSAGAHLLAQLPDPLLSNAVGSLHGGVATAGLELVASAAVNVDSAGRPMSTSSVRVNFLRPFVVGAASHYIGNAVRVGRQTAVADAQAIDDDGRPCLMARVTAYR